MMGLVYGDCIDIFLVKIESKTPFKRFIWSNLERDDYFTDHCPIKLQMNFTVSIRDADARPQL